LSRARQVVHSITNDSTPSRLLAKTNHGATLRCPIG
jgi:hypothetical protein